MKHWYKIQIYEIQVLLYWILGVLILNIGQWKWVGWVAIVYGWLTVLYLLLYTGKNVEEIKNAFDDLQNAEDPMCKNNSYLTHNQQEQTKRDNLFNN